MSDTKMPRNMSFMLTTEQIKNRTKTVTRRLGWKHLRVNEVVNACEKCMGLKKGERVIRLNQIQVISTRRESLDTITQADVVAEGFPDMSPDEFIQLFMQANECQRNEIVTRIEFSYLCGEQQ